MVLSSPSADDRAGDVRDDYDIHDDVDDWWRWLMAVSGFRLENILGVSCICLQNTPNMKSWVRITDIIWQQTMNEEKGMFTLLNRSSGYIHNDVKVNIDNISALQ